MIRYIIHKTNFSVSSVENPDEMQENGYSNFDNVWKNIPESIRNSEYCRQDTLPSVESIYWKFENGQIVEMTTEEKAQKDQEILLDLQKQKEAAKNAKLQKNSWFGIELSNQFKLEFNFTSVSESISMDDKLFHVNRNLAQGMLLTAHARLQEIEIDSLLTQEIKDKYLSLLLTYINQNP